MAIDAEGDGDRRMAKPLLDYSRVDSLLQRQRCPGLPKAARRQSG